MIQTRLLAVLTFIAVVAALKLAYPVAMPLAVALVIVAAAWPLQPWLEKFLPRPFAYAGAALALFFVLGLFLFATYLAAVEIAGAFAQEWQRFESVANAATAFLERFGVRVDSEAAYQRAGGAAQAALAQVSDVIGYTAAVAALVIFALPEVRAARAKLFAELETGPRREVFAAVEAIAGKIRSYLGVTSALSLLSGIACYLFSLGVGLELALVWGVLNFLLNYIPIVGNIVGVAPPTLYALLQFQSATMTALVLAGLSVIHVLIRYVVAPLIQQRSLALSPLAIIVALAFWGWLWGIAGALIAVPATAALAIACDHFQGTRWIALLLSTPWRDRPPASTPVSPDRDMD